MTKKATTLIIVLTVFLSLIANVFFGRWLSAKISTMPLLNRFKILSPQAPIVINSQQVIRSSDGTDMLQAAQTAKSKIATVVTVGSDNSVTAVGGAVTLTSDGVFVTGSGSFLAAGQKYFVVLSDGSSGAITTTTPDTALGLTFFKATVANASPATLGNSSNLVPGEKLLFLTNSIQSFMPHFEAGFISRSQNDVSDVIFDANKPSRSFEAQLPENLVTGQAVVSLSGQVVGIWNGSKIVSSDVLGQAVNLYLSGNQKISHPTFNFSYSIITKPQSQLSGLSQGALVKLSSNKDLLAGDIITSVDGGTINETNLLEPLLQKYKKGDTVKLVVFRNKQNINLTINVQ